MKTFENDERYGGEYRYDGERTYRVDTAVEAWLIADKIFPCEFERDDERSERAGYPIYYGTKFYNEGVGCWISALGDRLEVCLPGATVNIWIRPRFIDDETYGSAVGQDAYNEMLAAGCVEASDEEAKRLIGDLTGFSEDKVTVKHVATVRKCAEGDAKTGVETRYARVPLRDGNDLVYALFEVEGKCNDGQWEILNTTGVARLHRIERI